MSGIAPGGSTDFSARLQAALGKAKGRSVKAAEPLAPEPVTVPPDDQFQQRLGAAMSQARGEPQPSAEAEPAAVSGGPVGEGEYVVHTGDCISSIACESGHFWETLWNEPANAALKQARGDPNVLLEGDRLTVPELQRKDENLTAEKRHRFKRKGEPSKLNLRLLKNDEEPYANEPYKLIIDGEERSGTTDPDGRLSEPLPGSAQRGKIIIGPDDTEYKLMLGSVSPISELVGVQERLNNLGLNVGDPDGELNDQTRAALQFFQRTHGLEETGEPDDETRTKLKEEHGC